MTRYRILTVLILSGFLGILFPLLPAAPVAHAGGTIKIDDTRSLSIGMGLRTSFDMIKDEAPDGKSRSKDFKLDDARLYISGQLHELISFEFNTETQTTSDPAATESIRVLDAVLKFGFNDYFNIWVGRFLPPSDRSNLSGPFYLNSWNFPMVQRYPAIFAGRDDGAAIWGQIGKGFFKYQVGAFQGEGAVPTGPNQKEDLLYTGRLTLNLWDPEPGYYNSSTYYGAMNVLALGLVAMTQKNAVGTAAAPGNFTGWSADLLVERNLGSA
ncbi:MAG TPA: porin, partial [Candidatus Manganitrophaceae bacterium]|nr:porin [Candidatus Manganitrophaceae bacterium]